jgi:DNA mismatch repair ATPase MutS
MFITEKGNELESIETWLSQPEEKSPLLPVLCVAVPVLNICWIALIIAGTFPVNSLLVPIMVSLSIAGSKLKTINKAHSLLSKTAGTLKSYTTIIRLMEREKFQSTHLKHLQEKLSGDGLRAGESLTSLFKLLNSFDQRLNILVAILLNILFLYDIQVWLRLGKWKARHKTAVASWFEALSELDALASLSVYAFNNAEAVTYPVITEGEFTFEATEMGHPLLHPGARVCNTVSFSGAPRILVITGANMAGKSTFLRTLSVNLILAMNGVPVCAKAFRFTPCDLLSSIKIQDSLSNHESYFYAELVRIRQIIEHLQANPRTLVVLDEILRGTNTHDKQTGSRGLLGKLVSLNAVAIVATHDLTLGELETAYPGTVLNHCFEVELTGDQLIFDYKLKPGISQKLNASYLMKKMGIIE